MRSKHGGGEPDSNEADDKCDAIQKAAFKGARSVGRLPEDAADDAQEVVSKILKRGRPLSEIADAGGYGYKAGQYQALESIRREVRRGHLMKRIGDLNRPQRAIDDQVIAELMAEEVLEFAKRELAREKWHLLTRIWEESRPIGDVLKLVAKENNEPLATVRKRFQRTCSQLQKNFAPTEPRMERS